MTRADFRPLIGSDFQIQGGHHRLGLVRIEPDVASPAQTSEPASFTMIFRVPKAAVLPEGLHACEIEGGPTRDLYIMPVH